MVTTTALLLGTSIGVAACVGSVDRPPPRPVSPITTAPARSVSPDSTTATAPSPQAQRSASVVDYRSWLVRSVEDVASGQPVFGLHDNAGNAMDTLKVLAYPGGYVGVYHSPVPGGFVIRVATSTDLRHWRYRAQLDRHASQPTLCGLDNGGYVLGEEADNGGGVGPGRRWVRLRYYPDIGSLLSARPDRTFNTPHTLTAADRGAEGTPNIYTASMTDGPGHSVIRVGFHYLSNGVDREARGVLTNFSTWATRKDTDLDRALLGAGMAGKHGDRDSAKIGPLTPTIVEAQRVLNGVWHVLIFDPASQKVTLVPVHTPASSKSFANPTFTMLRLPTGRIGLVVTVFVPTSGSSRGEAGELLYYHALPT